MWYKTEEEEEEEEEASFIIHHWIWKWEKSLFKLGGRREFCLQETPMLHSWCVPFLQSAMAKPKPYIYIIRIIILLLRKKGGEDGQLGWGLGEGRDHIPHQLVLCNLEDGA